MASWQTPFSITLMSGVIVTLIGHIIWICKVKKVTLKDLFTNTTIVKDLQGGGDKKRG